MHWHFLHAEETVQKFCPIQASHLHSPTWDTCFLSFYLELISLNFQLILPLAPHSNPTLVLYLPSFFQKWKMNINGYSRGWRGASFLFFILRQETHQDVLLILLQGVFKNSFPFICTSPFNFSLQHGESRTCHGLLPGSLCHSHPFWVPTIKSQLPPWSLWSPPVKQYSVFPWYEWHKVNSAAWFYFSIKQFVLRLLQ